MVEQSLTLIGADQMRAMLNGLPADIQRELRPALKDAGDIVARQARANASWSSRIPGAISVRASFGARSAGATVVVDSAAAPHARPYEGVDGNSTFRHPVHGSDRWVSQTVRPFLMPAGRAKEREAALLAQRALQAALPN